MKRTIYKGVLMRWGVLTAWMCAFGLSGTAMPHAQETLLNISVREATVREVIELIKSQSDYTFVYNVEELSGLRRVSIEAEQEPVGEVLRRCLDRTGYVYRIEDRVVIIKRGQQEEKKTVVIRGRVTDENKEPLPGVTVRLKGAYYGTTTDVAGRFSLTVPEGKEYPLLFSFVGMVTREMMCRVGENEIVLKENVEMLEEVTVTTGYQTINKTRMTGAVETVTARDISNKGFASIGDILRGAMSGVSSRLVSGKPGAQPEIRIRGLNSLYGDMSPTWIVDGVPFNGNLNDLVPEDIESITVLKDAAATAIYGSQAANGVIVVKRKRGHVGTPSIHVTSSFEFQTAPRLKLKMMNTEEKIAFERSVYEDFPNYSGGGRVITLLRDAGMGKITHTEAEAEIRRLSQINTDWYDEVLRKPFSHNHNISFSGGSEKLTYYASLGIRQSKGLVPTNDYRNWSAMLRLSNEFNKRFSLSLDLSTNIRRDEDSDAGVSVFNYVTFANPYERPYDEEGNMEYDRSWVSTLSTLKDGYADDFNIFNELYNNTSITNTQSNRVALELKVGLLEGLNFKTIGSVMTSYSNVESILGEGTYTAKTRAWIRSIYRELPDYLNKGELSERDGRTEAYTWQNQLEYNKDFKETHYLSLFLGHEMAEFSSYNNYSRFPEYNDEKGLFSVPEIGPEQANRMQAMIANLLGRNEARNRQVSFFLSGSYSYRDRYVFSASARMDGADVIGSANRFSPLWNTSFKYNLHREDFMKKLSWLHELAFRVSYGYTGSIDKRALPFNVLYYNIASTFFNTLIPSHIDAKNPSVKWQQKEDRSFGLDAAFFKGRLRTNVNYYNNVTRNLMDQKTLPISVGINSIEYNNSSVRNSGWELNFYSSNVQTKNFRWVTTFNFSLNRSKVLKSYYKSVQDIPKGYEKTEPVEGTSTNSWLGYRFAGIDPLTGHTLALVDNTGRDVPIGFQREDGSWVLDMDEANETEKLKIKQTIGNSYPPVSGGFGMMFSWKRLTLNTRFAFMAGHQITSSYYSVAGAGSISSVSKNAVCKEMERWRKPGDVTDIPGYNVTGQTSSLQMDWYDRKLETGNYLKCQEISLSYVLPSACCKKLLLESCRVNLNVRDIFTLSRYKGPDPENFGAFQYPIPRRFVLSLSVGI